MTRLWYGGRKFHCDLFLVRNWQKNRQRETKGCANNLDKDSFIMEKPLKKTEEWYRTLLTTENGRTMLRQNLILSVRCLLLQIALIPYQIGLCLRKWMDRSCCASWNENNWKGGHQVSETSLYHVIYSSTGLTRGTFLQLYLNCAVIKPARCRNSNSGI